MVSDYQQPLLIKMPETEFKFLNTSREKLNWFYHLLVIDFQFDMEQVQEVTKLLNDWTKDYEFSLVQQLDHRLSKHPLLAMAFNTMVNSDETFIRLKVCPHFTKYFRDEFQKYHNDNLHFDKETLTQQYLIRKVEKKAIEETRYPNVLHAIFKQKNEATECALDAAAEDSINKYCQKLLIFYGYSEHWDWLMKCMVDYRYPPKYKEVSKPEIWDKITLDANDESQSMDESDSNGSSHESTSDKKSDNVRKRLLAAASMAMQTSPDTKQPRLEESQVPPKCGIIPMEHPCFFEIPKEKPKEKSPEYILIKYLSRMLQFDNKQLLLEFKSHVYHLDKIADKVLSLSSYPILK